MKKLSALFAVIFLASALSACADKDEDNNNVEVTTTAAATEATLVTSLTTYVTTEYVPEELKPEPEPEEKTFLLGVYEPFSNSVKVDNSVNDELLKAIKRLADERMILYGNCVWVAGEDDIPFYSEENALEKNEEEEYSYCPVDPYYAKDEDDLFARVRNSFTRNYISDEEIKSSLFGTKEYRFPSYKTIDGQLCVRSQYLGVPYRIDDRILHINYYDGKTVDLVAAGHGIDEALHVYMKLIKDDEHGWQLDTLDYKPYAGGAARLMYNAIVLRRDKLNDILGGGNLSDETVTIDGEEYAATDLDMTLNEMREFFFEMFRDKTVITPVHGWEKENGEKLRDKYIEKYIDKVYKEKDGVLYRKQSAPEWYLPELKIDPYHGMIASGGGASEYDYMVNEQDFYDSEWDETFKVSITLAYKTVDYFDHADECRFLYLASELPIREKGRLPYTPPEVVENYINALTVNEDIFSVENIKVNVPQAAGNLYDRYSDYNRADEGIIVVLLQADYTVNYAESTGRESKDLSKWFAVRRDIGEVIDVFDNDPHTFTGTASEVTDFGRYYITPDEGTPEREQTATVIISGIYPVPYTLPENVGDRVEVTYNGSLYPDGKADIISVQVIE